MTIPQAVQFVSQASILGKGGKLFVLDMVELARDMITLRKPGEEIEIQFTGLRQGEKLFEELFLPGGAYERSVHDKICLCHNGTAMGEGSSATQLGRCPRYGRACG